MAKKLGGLGKGLNAIFIENDSEKGDGAVTLKISEIEPNRSQPRKDFDEQSLGELAESISSHGLLQPLLVRPLPLASKVTVAVSPSAALTFLGWVVIFTLASRERVTVSD